MGTFRETLAEGTEGALGPERPRVYSDLSPEDKERYNAGVQAQNRVGNDNPGQARQVKCYNCNGIGHIARNYTQPKRDTAFSRRRFYQFCDGDLEVAFRFNTFYVRNLEGEDLLTGSRDSNLYTISISDLAASSQSA
ncbi:integrase, catalytic region, zinc finger, CCHC-type containing protein [Tanacetum coccineum]